MAEKFDIIRYISGLTGFNFDRAVLERIALENGVMNVTSYSELEQRQKDLLLADLLYTVYISPNSTSSVTKQHGAFSQTVGSQTINDKDGIFNAFYAIYKKYGVKDKLEAIENLDGGLQWLE